MEKIYNLLAITWPIISQVFKLMRLEEKFISLIIFIFFYILVVNIFITIFPRDDKKRFLDNIIFPLIRIYLMILPLVLVYQYLKGSHPILVQLVEFIANFFTIDELIEAICLSIVMTAIFYALARFFWHSISMFLQYMLGDIPVIGPFLLRVIIGMEVLAILATYLTLPVFAMSFFKGIDPYPLSLREPIVMPPGVDEEVWEVIEKAVNKSLENGVNCSPYLLYSLKIYETGENYCDEAWEYVARPNACASNAGALGMWQFLPETFSRNANRHNVQGSLWNPEVAAEVACYFMADEVNISLNQTKEEFVEEFASTGLIWNADPYGAGVVYDRAVELRNSAFESPPNPVYPSGYVWPGPENTYVWYPWGDVMWYGQYHNGIDIGTFDGQVFDVKAISSGMARYYYQDECNRGVIHFIASSHEQFYYVHMSEDPSKIYIKTDGSWVAVDKGQTLGQIHEGNTSCSIGSHLHLMYTDGRYIGEEMFER